MNPLSSFVQRAGAASLLLVTLAAPLSASAALVDIDYQLNALAAPGRYEYVYTVTNTGLSAGLAWFTIDFDTALYDEASLLVTSTGLADWAEQLLGSFPGLPAQYDAYNVAAAPLGVSASQSGFRVAFTWLGTGLPGTQVFTILDPGTGASVDSGSTTLAGGGGTTPAPSALALMLIGLAACAGFRRQRT